MRTIINEHSSQEIYQHCQVKTLGPISRAAFRTSKNLINEQTNQLFGLLYTLAHRAEKDRRSFVVSSGFVVDLSEGMLLRNHHDLDVLALEPDYEWLREVLREMDFVITPFARKNPETSFQAKKGELRVDVGAVSVTADHVTDKTASTGEVFIWPVATSEFLYMREVDDVPIFFVNPKVILLFKQNAKRHSPEDEFDISILAKWAS